MARRRLNTSSASRVRSGNGPMLAWFRYSVSSAQGNSARRRAAVSIAPDTVVSGALGTTARTDSAFISEPRVVGLAERVTYEVEAQHREADGDAGRERDPGCHPDQIAPVGHHRPPAGRGRLRAQP